LNYNEDPDAGLSIDAQVPLYTWPGGSLSGYPGGLVNKGLKQPCNNGYDCQFNTQCVHPKTATACSHSKCLAGAALSATCRSADVCVDEICNADPTCCSGSWTAACVAKVGTICDAKCGTSYTAPCAFNPCTATPGTPLNLTCHPCVANVCALNPSCCTTSWDATCVAAVGTICGQSCPLNMTLPPPEDGTCTPWIPGEKDPTCPGIDLSGGTPCSNNIPICNHGNTTAPAGVRIVHYPANSNQYPKCDPDQTHPQMYECFTTEAIKAGECTTKLQYWDGSKWVAGCDQLTGNREIMINPQVQSGKPTPAGYPGYVAECSCKDNWTLYSGATCGPPVCSSGLSKSTFKKQNLFLQVDRSGSMSSSGLWDPMKAALKTFFEASTSAGLGIALEYFPADAVTSGPPAGQHDGCAGSDCDASKCAKPWVPLGTLTAAPAPSDSQEGKLVGTLTGLGTAFGTPMHPALDGALQWATTQKASKPNEDFSVILITDGDPYGCNESIPAISALASAAYLTSGIKTYVVSLPGSTVSNLDQIAIAGGTGGAIQVTAAALAAELITAFQGIANASAKCDFQLPNAALYDKNDVTVTFTSSTGTKSILTQRNALANCGAGWYFDNNTTPTKVILCPTSCAAAQSDVGSSVELNVGCPKALGPMTHYLEYEGQCPPGAKPIWNFFAYDTVCPGDSSIAFSARTATTQAGLASASWHSLATATSTPNTQVCPMSGPSPCPVDLFGKLGFPDQKLPWLELKVDMTPTSDKLQASVVNSWLVTYSCPPSE